MTDTHIIIDDPITLEPLPPALDATPADAPAAEAEAPKLTPFALVTVDITWPDEANRSFTIELPQPAVFQRLVRAEVPSPILGGRRKMVMRAVYLIREDGPPARCHFVAQHVGDVMQIPEQGGGPRLLSTVVDSFGNPIAVWQRSAWIPVPQQNDAPVIQPG